MELRAVAAPATPATLRVPQLPVPLLPCWKPERKGHPPNNSLIPVGANDHKAFILRLLRVSYALRRWLQSSTTGLREEG